ncbi:MAG: hypothetical protein WBQ17_10600 [Rhizomicrobium sp.]
MRLRPIALIAAMMLPASLAGAQSWHYGSTAGANTGIDADLNGAVPFPANNAWNTDISQAQVDPKSDAIIASIGADIGLHPDFGSGTYAHAIIGIPYVVVGKNQMPVQIRITTFKNQSDPGPFAVPQDAPVEGYKPNGNKFGGDRHVLVIDKHNDRLYEMWRAFLQSDGSWKCRSAALFQLNSNDVRPTAKPGWTSADAAGLPIFPGLIRYDEVAAGEIPHALRFTVSHSREAYVLPANHWASDNTSSDLPPMGMRVRLKASYRIPSAFSAQTKTILRALKTYGMMVADNGSDWYLSGAPDPRWKNGRLVSELRQVTGSDFEVVKMGKIVTP